MMNILRVRPRPLQYVVYDYRDNTSLKAFNFNWQGTVLPRQRRKVSAAKNKRFRLRRIQLAILRLAIDRKFRKCKMQFANEEDDVAKALINVGVNVFTRVTIRRADENAENRKRKEREKGIAAM